MPAIIAFLATKVGTGVAIFSMCLVAWFGFARHYEKKGAARVSAQIEKKVEANAQKAEDVRNAVQSVPASGLRDKFTRD